MDEGQKKNVMLGIVVFCIVVAGIIFWTSGSGNDNSGLKSFEGKTTWMKCNNPKCGHAYEFELTEYFEFMQKNAVTLGPPPGMECPECGEKSAFRAFKCPKCEQIHFYGQANDSYPDMCPKCKYSVTEERRFEKSKK
jgi:hypothetical protein